MIRTITIAGTQHAVSLEVDCMGIQVYDLQPHSVAHTMRYWCQRYIEDSARAGINIVFTTPLEFTYRAKTYTVTHITCSRAHGWHQQIHTRYSSPSMTDAAKAALRHAVAESGIIDLIDSSSDALKAADADMQFRATADRLIKFRDEINSVASAEYLQSLAKK